MSEGGPVRLILCVLAIALLTPSAVGDHRDPCDRPVDRVCDIEPPNELPELPHTPNIPPSLPNLPPTPGIPSVPPVPGDPFDPEDLPGNPEIPSPNQPCTGTPRQAPTRELLVLATVLDAAGQHAAADTVARYVDDLSEPRNYCEEILG